MSYKNRVEKQREKNRLIEERRKAKVTTPRDSMNDDTYKLIIVGVAPWKNPEETRHLSKKTLAKRAEEKLKKEPIK